MQHNRGQSCSHLSVVVLYLQEIWFKLLGWRKRKSTKASNNTAATAMMQDSPLLCQEFLWSQSAHSHQSPRSLSRSPCHLTCFPRLFFKTLGNWAFSRVKWIWPFPNTPQLQPTQGVWAHTLAPKLFQGPCDRPAAEPDTGRDVPAGAALSSGPCWQMSAPFPSAWLKEPSSTLLASLCLQDIMGAIIYVETFWSLVILGVSGNKADTLLGNPF